MTKRLLVISLAAFMLLAGWPRFFIFPPPITSVYGDSAGPRYTGTGADDATVGTVTWSSPTNIYADTNYATAALGKSAVSHYLKATNFGFTIPDNSTINGITVTIDRREGNTQAAGGIKDNEVKLVDDTGVILSTSRADTATFWPTSDGIVSYGGVSDNWGETAGFWTSAKINDLDFGVVISVINTKVSGGGAAEDALVDYIQITVTYTPPQPDLTQIHYRWRNDDNNEASASWRKDEDTSMNRTKSVTMRLRVEISNEGFADSSSTAYRIEYATQVGGACGGGDESFAAVPVTATSEPFDIQDSTNLTDGASSTNISSGLTDENATFVAGQVKDTSNETSGITLTTTQFTEIEYALQANTNAVTGTTYCFRVTNAGSTTYFTYSAYPQWTVGEPIMDQKHFRWRNDDGGETSGTEDAGIIRPDTSDVTNNMAITGSACSGAAWCTLDDSVTQPTAGDIADHAAEGTDNELVTVNTGTIDLSGGTVPSIVVWLYATGSENVDLFANDPTNGQTTCASNASVPDPGWVSGTCTFASALSQSDLDSLTLTIRHNQVGGAGTNTYSTLYAQVNKNVTAATWKQNEDVVHSGQATASNIRLRFSVANTGEVSGSRDLNLEYAQRTDTTCGDETFVSVPVASGSPFEMVTSANFADSDPTTAQLTSTGTFTAGKIIEDPSNTSGSITIDTNYYTEVEYVFQAASSAGGNTYCFRVSNAGTALDTYTKYAEISVTAGGAVISVVLDTDGSITYGTLAALSSQDTTSSGLNDTQTARNDGTVTETFNIKTSNATGGTQWTLGSSAGSDIFVHEFSTNSGGAWTKFTTADSYQQLATGITSSSSQNFDLRITVPSTSTDFQQKNISVTIQAVQQ
ncbi:MAG: Secreted protein [Candidatus Collierbacteria bacterium GW2011_GWF2_44_15]|uniref:Secreted protein n=3 Tax=Candidatus Collieribacteriota TaxID=1752725 RepID=A0A0G1HGU0_9BACT|nr:MAG: Secreted protein [Candidatus Collierbacteria bacterium GW2011_GWF1_44_12]KKT46531.1 MAG: Secreted protein [Candidatus Collierbacteria bacterium GW2011_GWF2_44_15]